MGGDSTKAKDRGWLDPAELSSKQSMNTTNLALHPINGEGLLIRKRKIGTETQGYRNVNYSSRFQSALRRRVNVLQVPSTASFYKRLDTSVVNSAVRVGLCATSPWLGISVVGLSAARRSNVQVLKERRSFMMKNLITWLSFNPGAAFKSFCIKRAIG